MIALGKGKAEDSEPEMDSEDSGSSADAYAKEAFAALKDDDEAGFVAAFLGAVKACKADSYEEEEEEA